MSKRGYLSPRQHAAIRLNELIRSYKWRRQYKVEIKPGAWLFVICHALAPLKEREGGLDLVHLKEFINRHNMALFDDDKMSWRFTMSATIARDTRNSGACVPRPPARCWK